MRRRTLIIIIAALVIVLLAGGYSYYWFRLKQTVADDIAFWIATQRAQGFSVTINEHPDIGGFPMAVTADLGRPDIVAPGGLWRWQGPQTELLIRPWAPFDLSFRVAGHHHLTIAGNTPRNIGLDAGSLVLREKVTADNIVTDFGLEGSDIRYADNTGQSVSLGSTTVAGHLPRPAKPGPDTSILDLAADAAAIDLPPDLHAVLGQRIAKIHLVSQLTGAFPDGPPREALTGWRDGGGILQVRESALDWGPLSASGDGTVTLDENMQPLAAGTVHVAGLPETLDLLSSAGLIQSAQAAMAKLMFGVVAQTPAGGGKPQVSVSLTIQNGFVYLGPIKLAPLQPIDWSQVP